MEPQPDDAAAGAAAVVHHEPEARPSYAESFAFFGHLAYRVPELRDTLAQHLVDTEGEMLPHLLMEDVLVWILEQLGGSAGRPSRLALDILDDGYRNGSDALRSLVIVSFLEAIPGFDGDPSDPAGRGRVLRGALGPTLAGVLLKIESVRRDGSTPLG